jgi:hypothetical protein
MGFSIDQNDGKIIFNNDPSVEGISERKRTSCYIEIMKYKLQLKSVSDDEILRRLSDLLQQSRRVEADLVAHIGEVDERRLYASEASPSMFAYCTEVLNLSEHEAYLRITVARASRQHPILLEMLADGRLHLSGIAKLAPHLTEVNREAVLKRATHKSKRQIEELVAELSPKPDIPSIMRKLPEPQEKAKPSPSPRLGPDGVVPPKVAEVTPIAPARYKVTFTASVELHDKLERLQKLTGSSDLAAIIEGAVTEKLERLEAKRFGKTNAPRKTLQETDTSPSTRHIPAAVKRAVFERNGGQCAFVDKHCRRCTESARLEFHHLQPFGRGGDHSPENIRLLCRAHNGYVAECDYGKKVMERYRRSKRSPGRVSEPAPVYYIVNRNAGNPRCSPP